jgi:anaerobic nitric oxide reductase transcription regulator
VRRIGLVEFADRGTLVLDEILNLPLQAQQLLLDFTQFGTYRPLGHPHAEPKRARVRIVAATNGDLDDAVRVGRFREDLYHRLSMVTLVLPPLRERGDVLALAEAQLRRAGRGHVLTLSLDVRRLLLSEELAWQGNIRQLDAVLQRARERALARNPAATSIEIEHLEARDLRVSALPGGGARTSESTTAPGGEELAARWQRLHADRERLDGLERDLIEAALARHGGVVARAARELGMARTSLVSRMQTLEITGAR